MRVCILVAFLLCTRLFAQDTFPAAASRDVASPDSGTTALPTGAFTDDREFLFPATRRFP